MSLGLAELVILEARCAEPDHADNKPNSHPWNYSGVGEDQWWVAQLIHYGLAWDPSITAKQARRHFRSILREQGQTLVPSYMSHVEARLRMKYHISQRPIESLLKSETFSDRDQGYQIKGAPRRWAILEGPCGFLPTRPRDNEHIQDLLPWHSLESISQDDVRFHPEFKSVPHLEQSQPSHFPLTEEPNLKTIAFDYPSLTGFNIHPD